MRLTIQEIETQNANRAFGGKLNEQFYRQMRNELLDYKFIEKELGIDLITLVKAVKDGVWCKCCLFNEVKISHQKPDFILLKNKCLVQECDDGSLHSSDYFIYYHFKDYGKTWALTKEELL